MCVPMERALVVKLAWLPLTVLVPNVAAPSLKVTEPVAWPPNCGVIEAVNVTDCPDVAGLAFEIRPSAVVAWFTVWPSGSDVSLEKFESPL